MNEEIIRHRVIYIHIHTQTTLKEEQKCKVEN